MKCRNHPERDAVAVCISCHTPVCAECRNHIKGKNYCEKCVDKLFGSEIGKPKVSEKNPVLAAVLSIIPGLGQIYLGEVVRGIIFLVVALILAFSRIGYVIVMIIAIWDAYDRAKGNLGLNQYIKEMPTN